MFAISMPQEESIIVDSEMTFEEAIKGTKAPKEVIDNLALIDVMYYSFDGKLHKGQLLLHKEVESEIKEIFSIILKEKFPVNKAIPIVKYNWSDEASMEDNNSSAFNYRTIAGTNRMSNHAYGRAVDINPVNNPYVNSEGRESPSNGKYRPDKPGTFSDSSIIVKEFKKRGWRWGGNFNSYKDYHHFDKQ
jgi:hypothetical protein